MGIDGCWGKIIRKKEEENRSFKSKTKKEQKLRMTQRYKKRIQRHKKEKDEIVQFLDIFVQL